MKPARFRGYPAPMSPRSVLFSALLALASAPLAVASDAGTPSAGVVPGIAAMVDAGLLSRLQAQAPRLDPQVLGLALDAAGCAAASGRVAPPRRLAVIDYSRPSTEPRLWVFDLREARLLHAEHVAHGRRSGENFATAFSNRDSSHQTSLGLFATAETYIGGNGYSLRMDGLEPGINDRARDRAIVMHGAPYVDPVMAQRQGRLGRSLGCPAVRPAVAHAVIDTLKGGQLLFAYYPDQQWLANSKFFRCRAGLAAQGGASRPAGGR